VPPNPDSGYALAFAILLVGALLVAIALLGGNER
jgi:hypothetical protein